jgi:hypothetical protein
MPSPIPWPPLPLCTTKPGTFLVPLSCFLTPLPLRETLAAPRPLTAAAARTYALTKYSLSTAKAAPVRSTSPSDIVTEYLIGKHDMATIYMSPDPYFETFEEIINLQKFNIQTHCTGGLSLLASNNRHILGGMAPGTPGVKIPHWRSQLKGAWLIKVGSTPVSTIAEAQDAFISAIALGFHVVTLLFSHPEIRQDISHDGLPIVLSAPFSQQVQTK